MSSSDCKKFLIDYLLSHPMELISIYRGASEEFFKELGSDVAKENNWKRMSKERDGGLISRSFCLLPSKYDSGVAFSVYEDSSGKLSFGEYVGD